MGPKFKLVIGGKDAPAARPGGFAAPEGILNPSLPIPTLNNPHVDLDASLKAVGDLRLFLDTFFQVEKILEPLRVTKQHPLEAVYLIRFGHELRALRSDWIGLLDHAEATLRQEKTERKSGGGER